MLQLTRGQIALRIPEAQEEVNGIYLLESAREVPQLGEVILLGDNRKIGTKEIPYEVKVGDKVLVTKYAGIILRGEDRSFLVVQEADILAVVE